MSQFKHRLFNMYRNLIVDFVFPGVHIIHKEAGISLCLQKMCQKNIKHTDKFIYIYLPTQLIFLLKILLDN